MLASRPQMAEQFDPYHKWLAIPPKDQPPNHYRLLGVELFEPDLDVIESAADQRMAHVRSFQTGKNSALSQKLLNELAAARLSLLQPDRKARYDAELREKQVDAPVSPAFEEAAEPFPSVAPVSETPDYTHHRNALPRWVLPAGSAAIVVLLAAILLMLRGDTKKAPLAVRGVERKTDSPPGNLNRGAKQSAKAAVNDTSDRSLTIVLAPGVEMRFIPVPASDDGRVRPFYLGQTEVTQAQWSALMNDQPHDSALPQVGINHSEARAFCQRLGALAAAQGRQFRLPTRDEFVQAYGDLSAYTEDQVWSSENGQNQVHEVATRRADARGAFDLVGNVWEWSDDGRFYGMSASDSLEHRFLAYSSIPLPNNYQGTTIDYAAGNLGLRLATGDARPQVSAAIPQEEEQTALDSPEPRAVVLERLFAEPLAPPDIPGISADRLIVWNQHHGQSNDAGTRELDLTLFAQGKEVWKRPAVAVTWAADQDTFATLPLADLRFDRLRAEVTEFAGRRGGLAEIEIFHGTTNLARGCPTATAAFIEPRFPPEAVTDGVISQTRTEAEGYWLLPQQSRGWVDVDLSFAEPRRCRGLLADRVVVRNQHNGAAADRGTSGFNVALVANGKEVWRRDQIELPWSADADSEAVVSLPRLRFDRLRVEITRWQGLGGGLCEVEIWQGKRNLALGCPVIASSYHMQLHRSANLTDGITSSSEPGGYWLLPDNTPGWAEIDLSPNDPAIGDANGRLGAYRALADNNWPLGLAWLARSPDALLRQLARRELAAGSDARTLSALGDGWWDVAQSAGGEPRQRLLARALRRYAQALANLPAEEKDRLRRRRDEVLPSLAERRYLYFLEESEARLGAGDAYQIRSMPVVVGGEPSPNGLWLHPAESGEAWVRFAVPSGYHRFRGAVGINDSGRQPASPVTFTVSGDGRTLWTSQPHQRRGESESFEVNLSGVAMLQLTASVTGQPNWCHAVWIEPRWEE